MRVRIEIDGEYDGALSEDELLQALERETLRCLDDGPLTELVEDHYYEVSTGADALRHTPGGTIAKHLACLADAYRRCSEEPSSYPAVAAERWKAQIDDILVTHFPRGKGFETGVRLDLTTSSAEVLRFYADYRIDSARDSGPLVVGDWCTIEVTVRPNLAFDFTLDVSIAFSADSTLAEEGHVRGLEDDVHETFVRILNTPFARE